MSTRWNSGRLSSISPTASPRSTPSAASPAAIRSTRSAYSRHVSETASPGLRSAISSGRWAAVYWNAWTSVGASRASGRAAAMGAAWSSMPPTLTGSASTPPRKTNPRAASVASASSNPPKSRASSSSIGRPAGPSLRTQRCSTGAPAASSASASRSIRIGSSGRWSRSPETTSSGPASSTVSSSSSSRPSSSCRRAALRAGGSGRGRHPGRRYCCFSASLSSRRSRSRSAASREHGIDGSADHALDGVGDLRRTPGRPARDLTRRADQVSRAATSGRRREAGLVDQYASEVRARSRPSEICGAKSRLPHGSMLESRCGSDGLGPLRKLVILADGGAAAMASVSEPTLRRAGSRRRRPGRPSRR